MIKRVVLDTDVLVAALRSPTGASAEIVTLAMRGRVRLMAPREGDEMPPGVKRTAPPKRKKPRAP